MPEIVLRSTEEANLDFVLRAESAPENGRFVVVWSREQHAAAILDKDIAHRIVEVENRLVGFLILAGLANQDASIELRRVVIVDKGRGYGRAVVRTVKDLAFGELDAHRLWLDVKVHNDRARALYRDEGFVEEGTLRECVRAPGGYESLVVMSLLRDEYNREHGS